jgi:hypothetical protein
VDLLGICISCQRTTRQLEISSSEIPFPLTETMIAAITVVVNTEEAACLPLDGLKMEITPLNSPVEGILRPAEGISPPGMGICAEILGISAEKIPSIPPEIGSTRAQIGSPGASGGCFREKGGSFGGEIPSTGRLGGSRGVFPPSTPVARDSFEVVLLDFSQEHPITDAEEVRGALLVAVGLGQGLAQTVALASRGERTEQRMQIVRP